MRGREDFAVRIIRKSVGVLVADETSTVRSRFNPQDALCWDDDRAFGAGPRSITITGSKPPVIVAHRRQGRVRRRRRPEPPFRARVYGGSVSPGVRLAARIKSFAIAQCRHRLP